MWNQQLQSDLPLADEAVTRLAELTEGFSFAYLKELFLSAMMRWIATQQVGAMEQIMTGQISTLREQMVSANTLSAVEPEEPEEQQRFIPGVRMTGGRMRFYGGGMRTWIG